MSYNLNSKLKWHIRHSIKENLGKEPTTSFRQLEVCCYNFSFGCKIISQIGGSYSYAATILFNVLKELVLFCSMSAT